MLQSWEDDSSPCKAARDSQNVVVWSSRKAGPAPCSSTQCLLLLAWESHAALCTLGHYVPGGQQLRECGTRWDRGSETWLPLHQWCSSLTHAASALQWAHCAAKAGRYLLRAGSATAQCSGRCPVRPWISPKTGTPQLLQETCMSIKQEPCWQEPVLTGMPGLNHETALGFCLLGFAASSGLIASGWYLNT